MAGFWYPYKGPADALRHLGAFADATVGPGVGITWSDGIGISVLRRPRGGPNGAMWLNILRRHQSHPRPAAQLGPPSRLQRLEHWFTQAMQTVGEGQMRTAEAEMRANQAMLDVANRHIYQPVHQWLLKHKFIADGLGVAADVVGVIAGGAFIVFVLPEASLAVGVAGTSAAIGSALLLGVDIMVFATEVSGNEATSRRIEESHAAQWLRIVGTVMTLPDMAVGGVKALSEISQLPGEITHATAASRAATDAAEASRARAAGVAHPRKHPAAVQQHQARANRFVRAAEQQMAAADRAQFKLRLAHLGVAASYGATPTTVALGVLAPPDLLKTQRQRRADEHFLHMLAPEGGLPHDVRFEMRVSVLAKSS